ncbi:uncharacterized protein EKO05_0007963 [Ascochyta rabiei]|uniref:Uncharacterized protein n=1 Tax=Didymella rabiei TaxID=5454 RepID=A0A163AQ40_DIDRA|nr:uncharacterized protein EKO05_0007963 [Ascochyta rabiei]KZM21320.1 hypothetical protein ST47_g7534 [Ascochyta rabiei]UPX17619.1 hypothetical protein EKO05_0007963 [Ascochyta rabiei]
MWLHKLKTAYQPVFGSDAESEAQSLAEAEARKFEEDGHLDTTSRNWVKTIRNAIIAIAGLLCFWILGVTAWRTTLHARPAPVRYEQITLECGNTTAEAQARGCGFDLLSHNWVPPPCMDTLTESEYRAYVSSPERILGPYPYFLDQEGKQRIPDEHAFSMLANGPTLADQHVYTTREEHLAHCNFLLRRTHRAAQRLVQLNDENAAFWHTEHCLGELRHANKKPLDQLNEGFYVGYSPCTIKIPV